MEPTKAWCVRLAVDGVITRDWRDRGRRLPMNNSMQYRTRAVACADFAATFDDPNAKAAPLSIADAWLRPAEFVERNARELRTPSSERKLP
jgi:hypothetical protein